MTITTSAPTDLDSPPPPPPPPHRPRPTPGPGSGESARDERMRRIQLAMFTAGGVLMPFGILVICLGWYGSAHSHYEYDQNTYLVSGGILGLGLVFLGGFLYFGAWLSRMAMDQRRSSAQLTDAMLALADVVAVRSRSADPILGGYDHDHTGVIPAVSASELVRAGSNATVHRRDCALIASRPDLQDFVDIGGPVTTCRVCKPEL